MTKIWRNDIYHRHIASIICLLVEIQTRRWILDNVFQGNWHRSIRQKALDNMHLHSHHLINYDRTQWKSLEILTTHRVRWWNMINRRLQNQQSDHSKWASTSKSRARHFLLCFRQLSGLYAGKRQLDYLFPLTIAFWPSDEHLLIQEKTDRPLTFSAKDKPFSTCTRRPRHRFVWSTRPPPKGKIATLAILEANSVCFSC